MQAVPIDAGQASNAKRWTKVALQLLTADYNLDANVDVMIVNMASALPGASDAIVFAPALAERDMVARVLAKHGDKYTLAWFHHEMGEIIELYKNPAAYAARGEAFVVLQQVAHTKTILAQGTTPFDYYHPKVVRAHPDLFSHRGYDRARNDYDTP